MDKLERFDFQFLGAMINVEDDMFYGRSTMLKDVLNFIMDYGIKTKGDKTKMQADGNYMGDNGKVYPILLLKSLKHTCIQPCNISFLNFLTRIWCSRTGAVIDSILPISRNGYCELQVLCRFLNRRQTAPEVFRQSLSQFIIWNSFRYQYKIVCPIQLLDGEGKIITA